MSVFRILFSSTAYVGDVAWLGSSITDSEHLDYGSSCQVINRFPGFHEFAKKRWLARLMCSMARLDPDGFSFFPKTWLLPDDRTAVEEALRGPAIDPSHFCGNCVKPGGNSNRSSPQSSLAGRERGAAQRTATVLGSSSAGTVPDRPRSRAFGLFSSWSARSSSLSGETKASRSTRLVKTITTHIAASSRKDRVFILKPDAGAQGAGLRLVSGLDQVPPHVLEGQDGYIVQQYICNPYLLNNRKFDFRVYVLVTAVTPKLQVGIALPAYASWTVLLRCKRTEDCGVGFRWLSGRDAAVTRIAFFLTVLGAYLMKARLVARLALRKIASVVRFGARTGILSLRRWPVYFPSSRFSSLAEV